MYSVLNLKAHGLQQQKATLDATHVSYEHETEATTHQNWRIEDLKNVPWSDLS